MRRRADRAESGLDRLNWLSADPVDLRTGKEMVSTFKREGRVQFPPVRSMSIGMIRRGAQRGRPLRTKSSPLHNICNVSGYRQSVSRTGPSANGPASDIWKLQLVPVNVYQLSAVVSYVPFMADAMPSF